MCGIAGLVGDFEDSVIHRMLSVISHRGPDDHGTFIDRSNRVHLGHRRLSIIDLTPSGRQPMCYQSRNLWISYNGEVYNYKSIRKDLESKGFVFSTNSDTEVILSAYAFWGSGMLHQLRGMFAISIWDSQKKELFLARDRLGIKPLYYAGNQNRFAFASEVKAVLESKITYNQADYQSILDYIHYGSVEQPRTIIKNVSSLLPGHYMIIRADGVQIQKYWDLHTATSETKVKYENIKYDEAVSLVRSSLESATSHHLVGDVPVGAFLSGGMDSSAVVGLMSKYINKPIKTYSVGFSEFGIQNDELFWARRVANHFKTDHTEVRISRADVNLYFSNLMACMDQPSADGFNTYIVSKAARKGVTVSLSGLGGDEIFGGYPHFKRFTRLKNIFLKKNSFIDYLYRKIAGYLPSESSELINIVLQDQKERVLSLRRLVESDYKFLISNNLQTKIDQCVILDNRYNQYWLESQHVFDSLTYYEISTYLRDTLLRDADQLSMLSSLEVRPILLDHTLVELVYSIPASKKISKFQLKGLMADSLNDIIPKFVLRRRKKGFELPLLEWLNHPINEHASHVFASKTSEKLFSKEYIVRIRQEIKSRSVKEFRIWAYFILLAYIEENKITI